MRHVLLIVLVCALGAVDEVRRPNLGIRVDLVPDPLSPPAGLLVAAVDEDGNGARLGLQVGDLITGVDDRAVREAADLQAALATKQADDTLRLVVQRAGVAVELQGILQVPLGARDLARRTEALGRPPDPADLPRYSLQDLLVILRQIQRDLPAAAAEFKRIYPEGRFAIGIHIDIESHADPAVEPVADPVVPQP